MDRATDALRELGQSIWLDFISRDLIDSGHLDTLVADGVVTGLTSNPSIFAKAISDGGPYEPALAKLKGSDISAYDAFVEIASVDIRDAADALMPVYERTGGKDGFVSLEVPPALADDVDGTFAEAKRLNALIDRPNLMVKVPGSAAGIEALPQLLAAGVNTNVTLLFSPDVYRSVSAAYIDGIEARSAAGLPVGDVASVASFFVSRVDTAVDAALPAGSGLRGKAAVANARRAYGIFMEATGSDRWRALDARGAQVQRPLWASTSTKNPAYRDILYVEELIAPDTVNTLPEATIDAVLDHANVRPTIVDNLADAEATMNGIIAAGVDLDAIMDTLLVDGLGAFARDFDTLLDRIGSKLGTAAAG
jgi:transaldolase